MSPNPFLQMISFLDKYTWRLVLNGLDYLGLNKQYRKNTLMYFSIFTLSLGHLFDIRYSMSKEHTLSAIFGMVIVLGYSLACYIIYPKLYDKFKASQRDSDEGQYSIVLEENESFFIIWAWMTSLLSFFLAVMSLISLDFAGVFSALLEFIFFYSCRVLFYMPPKGKKLKDHAKAGVEKIKELTEAITPKPALIPATVNKKDVAL